MIIVISGIILSAGVIGLGLALYVLYDGYPWGGK